MSTWKRLGEGIRAKIHPTRKHGIKQDQYFVLRYRVDGKHKQEALGWASEGWTLARARAELIKLKEAARLGEGATTLTEKREHAKLAKEAEKRALALENQQRISLQDYWTYHYKEYSKNQKKESSFVSEEGQMHRYILPLLGHKALIDIYITDWDALIASMSEKNLSQRTKEYTAGTLRQLMRHAQSRGYTVQIPTAKQIGAQAPKDNRRNRILTADEAKKLLTCIEELDIATAQLTRFAMLTGCRLSEACFLTWGAVNLQQGIICFVNTKNKDNRTVYLSSELVDLLASIPRGEATQNVFIRNDGKPFFHNGRCDSLHYFKYAVKKLGLNEGRSKLDKVTFHTIRHTVATNLARTLDVRSLMDVMGWKVIAMAARYIHTQEEAKRRAADSLAESWK